MISVCIATYNGEKYIREQLWSILKQLSECDEIIISDDGSNDNTIAIIQSFNDKRIKLYKNDGNHGFTHNFENALSYSKGECIFLADQDDIWAENKVRIILDALREYDLVISDCVTIDSKMNIIQQSRFQAFRIRPGFWNHLIKSRYLGCCMAFNRRLLNVCMPFPKNDKLLEHDIWIAAVGFLYFRVLLLDMPLVYYRRHGENTSAGGFEKGYSFQNKIVRRLYRLAKLIERLPKVKRNR